MITLRIIVPIYVVNAHYQCDWQDNAMLTTMESISREEFDTIWLPTPCQYNGHLFRDRDSHYDGKTIVKLSYLYNANCYASKMASLYWDFSFCMYIPLTKATCFLMVGKVLLWMCYHATNQFWLWTADAATAIVLGTQGVVLLIQYNGMVSKYYMEKYVFNINP